MEGFLKHASRLATVATFGGVMASTCSYVLYPGEAAIIYNRLTGVEDGVMHEGFHLKVPFLQYPMVYDIKLRPALIETMTGTKDLQKVHIKLRVLFMPNPEKLGKLYQTLGLDYNERVLPSIGNEIMKAVVAEYNAEELVVKREKVSQEIRRRIRQKALDDFDIILEDISLMDISFGQEFMIAVEAKQVAQQEAQKHHFVVMKNEQEKLAAITRAEGEAEAARMISDAIKEAGPGLVELRRIETAKKVATALAESQNVHYVPSNSGNMMLGLRSA